ncbi:MAG: response regulator [Synergistales bacterium]|nr:response regulator [Synergistales bacterium]
MHRNQTAAPEGQGQGCPTWFVCAEDADEGLEWLHELIAGHNASGVVLAASEERDDHYDTAAAYGVPLLFPPFTQAKLRWAFHSLPPGQKPVQGAGEPSIHGVTDTTPGGEPERKGAGPGRAVDTGDVRRLQEELRIQRDRAWKATRAKSDFLANMSHEIRTPLNGIASLLQLLEEEGLEQSERKDYVTMALGSCRRMQTLLGDILDLSCAEVGKLAFREEQVSVQSVVDGVGELFLPSIRQKGLRYSCRVDRHIPQRVVTDETRLQQVLSNLLDNAVRFTDRGEVAISVALLQFYEGEATPCCELRFTVSDTGPGMDHRRQEQVFDVFERSEQMRVQGNEGPGLGLPMVKRLVELMCGTVSLESAPGAGTAFTVDIPFRIPVDEKSVEERNEPMRERAAAAGDGGRRPGPSVLFAEDEPVNRLAVRKLLERAGYSITEACDGQEALHHLAEGTFDCALMDIKMPVFSGLEVLDRVRNDPLYAHAADMPFIALTAYAVEEERDAFLEAGMDDYLAKPADRRQLLDMLGRYCGRGS